MHIIGGRAAGFTNYEFININLMVLALWFIIRFFSPLALEGLPNVTVVGQSDKKAVINKQSALQKLKSNLLG